MLSLSVGKSTVDKNDFLLYNGKRTGCARCGTHKKRIALLRALPV